MQAVYGRRARDAMRFAHKGITPHVEVGVFHGLADWEKLEPRLDRAINSG